ncbi:hypothetical protein Hanom_Chr11g01016841 [Helianthus anomalus]
MSDQNVFNAFQYMSNSERDEGPSETALGYEADTEGSFVFQAQTTETFPPEKKGWFNKGKREKRRKKKNQDATITLVEGPAQIPITKPLWEDLEKKTSKL